MDTSPLIDAFGALAQETRLQVFRLLLRAGPGGMAAGEVARRLGIPHNTLSTHLAILARSGLAWSRREGRQILYAVDIDGVRGLVAFLVEECCGGQPGRCEALLDASLPLAATAPRGAGCAA